MWLLSFFSLHRCQTSQVKYRSHTSIYIGCVTGIYYQLGFVQEYLCTLLPARNTNWLTPLWWLAGTEALHGMNSDSHKSGAHSECSTTWCMSPQAPSLNQCTSPWPGKNQETQGALTPPHSSDARSKGNSYYQYHDLVANSMGTGGWVLKFANLLTQKARGIHALSPNVMIVHTHSNTCKCICKTTQAKEHTLLQGKWLVYTQACQTR